MEYREKITRYRVDYTDKFGAKKLQIFLINKKLQRLSEFRSVQVRSPLSTAPLAASAKEHSFNVYSLLIFPSENIHDELTKERCFRKSCGHHTSPFRIMQQEKVDSTRNAREPIAIQHCTYRVKFAVCRS